MHAATARSLAAGLFLLAAAACTESVAPTEGPQDQLLFVSNRDGVDNAYDIFRMNADGTDVENLTLEPAPYYRSLALSPDGEQLAFYSDRVGCYNVWVIDADGTDPVQLTGPGAADRCNYHPRWSPDGSRIAFATTREAATGLLPVWAVYVMNADGSDARNVSSPVGEDDGGYASPAGWSPDGRVVFHLVPAHDSDDPRVQTYIAHADGSGVEPLFDRLYDREPAWSPDGSRVAFVSERDGEASLFVMNADGTDERKLTDHGGHDWLSTAWIGAFGTAHSPWSPDGTRIAFHNQGDLNTDIYLVNVDGTGLLRLTGPDEGITRFNGWSPDGTRIAFTGSRSGSADVYVVNADGTDLVNLTASATADREAVWLPRRP